MNKTIDFIYFNAGGGHRATALALQQAIEFEKRPWNVRLVNLFEVLDPKANFNKVMRCAPEDLYNFRLRHGLTLGLSTELKLFQAMIKMGHNTMVRKLEQHWLDTKPDHVVSLVPNFNKALYESITNALPTVPFVTVLTDMADYPPNFWIEPNQAQHLVCGTARAAEQARAAGYADEQISLTSGMILRPAFYEQVEIDHETECLELGLDPEKPTGIVMFGGHGSTDMLRIAKALPDIQLIFLCGMNATLNKKISALKPSARHVVIGFTQKISHYMQLGDFFIGKPGPSSLSEAVHMGLPVITFGNAWTMPQERYNTNWVREQGVGLVIPSLRAIRKGVLALLENLTEYQDTVSRIENRAVFEVTDILAQLMSRADTDRAAVALR
jgi:UDP-N-acetylglucosamine:LPS N-acetylglucosamine transferase